MSSNEEFITVDYGLIYPEILKGKTDKEREREIMSLFCMGKHKWEITGFHGDYLVLVCWQHQHKIYVKPRDYEMNFDVKKETPAKAEASGKALAEK